jgi:hypothetical protein
VGARFGDAGALRLHDEHRLRVLIEQRPEALLGLGCHASHIGEAGSVGLDHHHAEPPASREERDDGDHETDPDDEGSRGEECNGQALLRALRQCTHRNADLVVQERERRVADGGVEAGCLREVALVHDRDLVGYGSLVHSGG